MGRTTWAPGAPALAGAARALDAVISKGQSADAALAAVEHGRERAAVRAITLGSVRWYLRLAPAIDALLRRPRGLAGPVHALLVCAAHQIEYSRNVAESTVNAAVDAARLLGKAPAAALTNALLRRFVRERGAVLARIDGTLPGRTAHPGWLVEKLQEIYPGQALEILAANNGHPPLTLRVDRSRTTAPEVVARLREASIDAKEIQWLDSAVVLEHGRSVSELPGFAEGLVSVQDAGAQLTAALLQVHPGQRVLDACAAPGGKTGQLLEVAGDLDLTALDVSAERVALIEENLVRLRRRARAVVGDLRAPASFWDGRPYERILVDAPCSSTGVIRRHPDIKLLRRGTDVARFAAQQLHLLRSAVALLAPGGRLLYVTCSVLPEENEQVVGRLLEEMPALTVAATPKAAALAPGALDRAVGVQLLPGAEAGTDGFYYACLEKTTAGT
ncbi:MAG TPA: 16S rRNA (cytosine(967)-C(5))-methyltransferase RsmB [Steroidobacteraceae bacterium]|nr:16S rRNA (cytosine(967)-C(5))-methyltransferase RsmB [Steroidobacteraceae bacterium]